MITSVNDNGYKRKMFETGSFFHVFFRCCLVAVYIYKMVYYLILFWDVSMLILFVTVLLPATTPPVIIFCRCCLHTGKYLITSDVDTSEKRNLANISAHFRKNFKWPQWGAQGPGGNWGHEKNLVESRKSRVILLASIHW